MARYADELFMADQLLSQGGATTPEDHAWVNKLYAAYRDSAHAAEVARETPGLPDPWAQDTQPLIFEAPVRKVVSLDAGLAMPDAVREAHELREEARGIRAEFQRQVLQRRGLVDRLRKGLNAARPTKR